MDWNLVKTLVIFNYKTNEEVARVPFIKDDPNHGLPDWFFGKLPDGSFTKENPPYDNLETDDNGTWGWTPACGPAPCWTGKADSFSEAIKLCDEWFQKNY